MLGYRYPQRFKELPMTCAPAHATLSVRPRATAASFR